MIDVDMTFKTSAHLALLNYSQADEDGVMVLVSRQAIHEVSAEITRLRARLEEAEAAKADAWDDGFEIGRCTGHPQINPYRSKNDAN